MPLRGIDSQLMLFDPVSGTTGVKRIREALGTDETNLSPEQKKLRAQLIEASGGKDTSEILASFNKNLDNNITSFASREWNKAWDTKASRSGSMQTGEDKKGYNFAVQGGTIETTLGSALNDEGNKPPGRVFYVDETVTKMLGTDPIHKIVNIYAGLSEGLIVAPAEMIIPLGQNAYKVATYLATKGTLPAINELGKSAKDAMSDFAGNLWNNVMQTGDGNTKTNPGLNQKATQPSQENGIK